jgi:hypothetical protein
MSLHPKLTEGMTEVDCAREIARAAIWDSLYSEYGLRKAHREYALIKAVVQLGGFDIDGVTAEDETDDEPKEPMDIIRDLVAQILASIKYHEDGLRESHVSLALIKAVLIRGFPTEVDFEKIEQEERARKDPGGATTP